MTYYADLTPCDYFGHNDHLLAIGWLGKDKNGIIRPFNHGDVAEKEFNQIKKFEELSETKFNFRGFHICELCEEGTKDVGTGFKNIFVPDVKNKCIYVFPDALSHYIERHRYRPPSQFLEAIFCFDEWGNDEFIKAFKEIDPKLFDNLIYIKDKEEKEAKVNNFRTFFKCGDSDE